MAWLAQGENQKKELSLQPTGPVLCTRAYKRVSFSLVFRPLAGEVGVSDPL